MSSFVIDASVAIKWLINEPGSGQAIGLRRHALSAPDLLISECSNIIWKKVRLGELNADEASFAVRLITRADIELVQGRQLARRAIEMAVALDHSAYDCMYLALAEAALRPFVTADVRLLRKLTTGRTVQLSVTAIDLGEFSG